jgi:hypothetical protein
MEIDRSSIERINIAIDGVGALGYPGEPMLGDAMTDAATGRWAGSRTTSIRYQPAGTMNSSWRGVWDTKTF